MRVTDGVAGAPPLFFVGETGTCAANGRVSDGGSCVNTTTGDGNSWVARFAGDQVDDLQWGLVSGSAADQQPVIQAALTFVGNRGGGTVKVPPGGFTLKSQLVVPAHTTLQCSSNGMTTGASGVPVVNSGSVFEIEWGSGTGNSSNPVDAALQLRATGSVKDCGWVYPNVNYTATTPTEYGATILAYDTVKGNIGQTAADNFCFNCYSFLDFRGSEAGATQGIANARVTGNWGAPIAYGLRINNQSDWGRWDHNIFHACGFNIGGSLTTGLCNWSINNGIAFEVGPADWLNIDHEQEWGYAQGVYYTISGGSTYAQTGPLYVRDSQFDGCLGYCIGINPSATNGLIEVDVTNNRFTPYNVVTVGASAPTGGIALYANANFSGQISFQNNFMFGPMNYMVYASNFTDATIVNNRYSSVTGVSTNAEPLVTLGSGTTLIFEGNYAHAWPGTLDSLGTITNTPFTPSGYNFLN